MSMAKAMTRDVAARFFSLTSEHQDVIRHLSHPQPNRPHECVLWGKHKCWSPKRDELADLRFLGCEIDILGVSRFDIAYILNVHFRAGEWGKRPWCGSVITCVLDGRSLYARVNRFLHVEGDKTPGYASVSWFSKPVYLLDNPLVVQVTDDGDELLARYGCILRLGQIDPSRVMVELPRPPSVHYYMMRDTGYDTRPM